MRPKISGVILAALLLFAVWSSAQEPKGNADPNAPQPSAQTQSSAADTSKNMESEVLSKMHQANQMEVKVAELARSKAGDAHIRNYADLLIKDHQVADKMIQDLADKQGIALVEPAPKSDQEKSEMEMQKQAMADLQSLSGAEFDRKFVEFNKQAHDMVVQMTSTAAGQLKPGPVQMLVSRVVPILKQHDTLADHLGQRVSARK